MTPEELYKKLIIEIGIEEVHPLHKAMLEECCENVIEAKKNNDFDDEVLINSVQISFMTCMKTLKATFNATLESLDGDIINLNYRNQNFVISKDSPFLK